MPARLVRSQDTQQFHFITFSCYERKPLLATDHAKETVERILQQVRAERRLCIAAYVLMPEHVHLLINEPPEIPLAQFLKSLKQITSRRLKGDRKQFWLDRYFDANVHGEDARSEVIRYIHRNPVKRGLVCAPEQYRWSSFRHYATGEQRVVEIESEWVASIRRPLIAIKLR